mmetsp:Transcript_27920/g.66518  ORF Transcript_27920/g.66518 Transcript_27920/m.66518 type:complete len:91 (+) Transcript_27920:360-632(+)
MSIAINRRLSSRRPMKLVQMHHPLSSVYVVVESKNASRSSKESPTWKERELEPHASHLKRTRGINKLAAAPTRSYACSTFDDSNPFMMSS